MGRDKILAGLCGRPVLMYSVFCFESSSADEIIIATSAERVSEINRLLTGYSLSKPVKVICGGDCRAQSAAIAVRACDSRCDIVSIHDGARPIITSELADSVVSAAAEYGSALLAVRAKDTVKICDNGTVVSTPKRETLWQAQTPQAFCRRDYLYALKKADKMSSDITDDASLMELCGHKVKIVEGDYRNIKLTSPEDFDIAEVFLAHRNGKVSYRGISRSRKRQKLRYLERKSV